jgi:hypothetical protein
MQANKNYILLGTALVMLLLFFSTAVNAQKNLAIAKLDSVKLKIGDQTFLTLSIEVPAGSKVKFPDIADTINSHIEVISQTKTDTNFTADRQRFALSKKLLITSFDSGFFAIAPFTFIVNEDTLNPVLSEALLIQIQTVAVDTTQAIRDIKGPKDAPWNIREIIPYVIGGAVALFVALLVIYILRKRKVKPVIKVEKKVEIPPHIIALQQLQQLKEEKLWQEGKFKVYQIRLTEILRNYIEARFYIKALEQTTDETMRSFRSIKLPDELRYKLHQLLSLSDMVKFAKEQPLPSENEQSMEDAINFVTTTANTYAEQEEKEAKV